MAMVFGWDLAPGINVGKPFISWGNPNGEEAATIYMNFLLTKPLLRSK